MIKQPLVSVIVPTKNSEAALKKCLRSIQNQSYPNIEIIVVDNYSNDGTRDIAQKYGVRFFLKGFERSSQVNFGVSKAKGKYVYRVDSDFVLEPSVVEEAVDKCEKQGYKVVAIHNTSDSSISFWSKIRKLERDCYRNDELNVGARFLVKEVFEAIGGFDENLIAAEDYDLHNKILERKLTIGRITAEEVHIGEVKTLSEIVKKHYYYGKTIGAFIRKNPKKSRKQLSPIRLSYLKHWQDFLKKPNLMLGFIIYQFVRYVASIMGYINSRITR